MILGDPMTALSAPHSIVLTQKLAKKYFGEMNPIGKTLTLENKYPLTVTGVMKDLPKNSIFTFEGVLPYSFLSEIGVTDNSWGSNSIFTYVLLGNNANLNAINKKLTDIVLENNPETTTKFVLFPLLDIHLHAQFGFGDRKGDIITVIIFSLIALFILLIACINFINLSTAKASARGKEIGIKKVAGADQMTMIIQFMMESLLLVSIALILALLLVGLSLNVFNNISGKNFIIADLMEMKFIISLIVVGLVAALVSGIYPALYLSSFKPVTVLKGETISGKGNGRLRKFLVIVQFTLSILIATSSIFIYRQLKFTLGKDLGFDKENLICIPMTDNMKPKYYSLKDELLKETLIQGVTSSRMNPVRIGSNSGGASWDGKDPEKQVLIGLNAIDYDYLKTMKMKLVAGRDFSKDYLSDIVKDTTGNFLVNEEVVKIMGVNDGVGKNFSFMGFRGTIIGVMKNFHFKGADQPIEPIAFALTEPRWLNNILIRLTPGRIPESLKSVENIWKKVIPDYPLEYSYIDQDYENLFRGGTRLSQLLKYFTILAVIIACMGLYGLSSYSAERRTNEIGIRKVMGAGSFTVIYSLSKEFLILILISIVVAMPLGWIIVKNLLKQFAYRIDMSILVFAVIAVGAVVVAMLTVSFHAFKATGINPAEALKVE
jgi:putative ABC transport system permease protein